MLLTITTTHAPATDLGHLLHKHPGKAQAFDLAFGAAHVFYPEATAERCTAALLLDIDPVGLVRGREGEAGGGLMDAYVNDRPYVASSFLSVAIARVFGSALGGRCKDREALTDVALPLEARLPTVSTRGGEAVLRRLFEPLGWAVEVERRPLDEAFPAWGDAPTVRLVLRGTQRLQDLLSHLYVLLPVLDDDKHYWVGEDEVEKLLKHGERWLGGHPEKELIARRYLKHSPRLMREALARLVADEVGDADADAEAQAAEEEAVERRVGLNAQRMAAVAAALAAMDVRTVVDLGCGEGRLLRALLADRRYTQLTGLDASHRALAKARQRLKLERMTELQLQRITLLHGALTYRDARLAGFDAATLVEVIEHLDLPRLSALERVVFAHAKPGRVLVTTPNVEYNACFESLPAGQHRHRDHRFEWTRAEFAAWANAVAARNGYAVAFAPIGPEDAALGAPTQMALFARDPDAERAAAVVAAGARAAVAAALDARGEDADAPAEDAS